MPGPVTLADVAREAGVSLATASRAINGSSTRTVGAALRDRVVDAARRLGYMPDANAQAMARGRTTSVGLLVHDVADPYFAGIAAGVTSLADERGLMVTLAITGHRAEREIELVHLLRRQRARAIVVAGSRLDGGATDARLLDALRAYRGDGGAVAVVGAPLGDLPVVEIENRTAAAALARALHGIGYRRFGLLTGPEGHLTAQLRLDGLLEGLGGEAEHPVVVRTDFTRDGGHDGTLELLRRGLPEVVVAGNDVMAMGAMAALREHGLHVPDDVAVAGFDDIPTLRDVHPALTTVHLPLEEVGRAALRAALDEGTARDALIEGQVVLRESTPSRA
ncbi:LacI family DNA-binding transcriptional regulator [Luteimicrobium xylanilyticum]|uniref:HTH-type transcriptional repressor n=1 Tax=Luteimicrobium xylanilyticum TaxID=1133546 RepID=A0A5P9QBH2_9MICO|nr:LacI family DNA-binding transcriptional regulator [Luteimicrobium xylanilyticum]QFU98793.1 HTH-type transcriptional repressor [Luteimicrobium xylanilyticum]